jgi:hypothetical protein
VANAGNGSMAGHGERNENRYAANPAEWDRRLVLLADWRYANPFKKLIATLKSPQSGIG